VLALPGLLVALLMTATREPPRRHAPGRPAAAPLREVARALWEHRATLGPIYLGMALLSVGDFSLQNWFPTLLSRKFGMAPGLIGAELGPAAIAGAVVGAMGAGLLSDRRVGRGGVAARLPIAAVAAALAVWGALVMFASSGGVAIAIFMGWLVMSNAAGAIGITAVQELAPPPVRGVALALISFFNIGIGLGVGTTMTALLTDRVFHGPGGVGCSMTTMALPAAVLGAFAFLWARRGAQRAAAAA
jgi:predicted MFS family arabinose efflux permease